MRRELLKDCATFEAITGCFKTEKYFEDCFREKENCSTWPKRFYIDTINTCCNAPKLISTNEVNECSSKCIFRSEDYSTCNDNCIYTLDKFVKDKKLDVKLVKKILMENSNQSMPWEKIFDEGIEICLKAHKGELFMSHRTQTEFCLLKILLTFSLHFRH